MRRSMINCNQVQTQVITEGRWIEEDPLPHSSKHVVLVIPGNPGVPRFYEGFIKALNSRLTLDTPVWVIGHAGHVQPPDNLEIAMPDDEKWAECYSLQAQIQHKVHLRHLSLSLQPLHKLIYQYTISCIILWYMTYNITFFFAGRIHKKVHSRGCAATSYWTFHRCLVCAQFTEE